MTQRYTISESISGHMRESIERGVQQSQSLPEGVNIVTPKDDLSKFPGTLVLIYLAGTLFNPLGKDSPERLFKSVVYSINTDGSPLDL